MKVTILVYATVSLAIPFPPDWVDLNGLRKARFLQSSACFEGKHSSLTSMRLFRANGPSEVGD